MQRHFTASVVGASRRIALAIGPTAAGRACAVVRARWGRRRRPSASSCSSRVTARLSPSPSALRNADRSNERATCAFPSLAVSCPVTPAGSPLLLPPADNQHALIRAWPCLEVKAHGFDWALMLSTGAGADRASRCVLRVTACLSSAALRRHAALLSNLKAAHASYAQLRQEHDTLQGRFDELKRQRPQQPQPSAAGANAPGSADVKLYQENLAKAGLAVQVWAVPAPCAVLCMHQPHCGRFASLACGHRGLGVHSGVQMAASIGTPAGLSWSALGVRFERSSCAWRSTK